MNPARKRAVLIGAVAVAAVLVLISVGAVWAYREYSYATSIVRYTAVGGTVTVRVANVQGLGNALVTNKGYALYMFPPDNAQRVTCTGDCATAWPPLVVQRGGGVVAGPGVRANLLGTDSRPGGGRVVTYGGWPLYTYAGDGRPGLASGQAVDAEGGYWYVLRPSGAIVKSTP